MPVVIILGQACWRSAKDLVVLVMNGTCLSSSASFSSFEKSVSHLPSISREPSRSLMLRSPTAPWQTDETIPFCSQSSREALKICITGEIPQHAMAADKVDRARIS